MFDPSGAPRTEWRLRDYRVDPEHFEEFVEAWTAGVLPLRRRFGFRVLAWALPEESRFVWLLGYAGPGSLDEADSRYYASPERAAVTPEPAQWVLEKRDAMVTAVATEEER
jgi:hypothetical protein